MTAKTLDSKYIAAAVAPISFGVDALSRALTAAGAKAGLETSETIRVLSVRTIAGPRSNWRSIWRGQSFRMRAKYCVTPWADFQMWLCCPQRTGAKKLLVSDMDSTIIQQECLDELAAYAGLKDEIAAITARAMAGELDFEGALTERVGKLNGLSMSALQQCFDERITLMRGAKTLTATMAAHKAFCLLVSGGFTFFTSRVADATGFNADKGNTLIDDGEALTGEVGRPILGREAKLEALDDCAFANGITRADALAMGDGANDLAMIEAAGLGLAVHAKPIVADAADAAINVTDLTAALYFQGYTDQEIVWQG